MISLAENDEVKYFKIMWETMNESFNALIDHKLKDVWENPLLHIIMKKGEINGYLESKHWMKYGEVMIEWVQKYVKRHEDGYRQLFESISTKETASINRDNLFKIILKQIFHLIGEDKDKLLEMIQFEANWSYPPRWRGDKKKFDTFTLFKSLLQSENQYIHCFKLIMDNPMFNDKEMMDLLQLAQDQYALFSTSVNNRYQGITLELCKQVMNDRSKVLQLLQHKNDGLRRIFLKKDRRAAKILDMALDSKVLSHRDLMCIFTKEYNIDDKSGRGKTLLVSAASAPVGTLTRILRFIDPKGQKHYKVKELLYKISGVIIKERSSLIDIEIAVVMELFRYFRYDAAYLKQLLLYRNKYGSILERIFHDVMPALQSMLLDEIPELNIIKMLDYDQLRLVNEGCNHHTFDLLDHFMNDRGVLLKLLGIKDKSGKTLWGAIWAHNARNRGEAWRTAAFPVMGKLLDGVLSIMDFYNLSRIKDNESKTCLHYIFERSDRGQENSPAKWFINHFKGNGNLLIKMLMQKTKDDKPCIMFASEEHIYDIFNVINMDLDKVLVDEPGYKSIETEEMIEMWKDLKEFMSLDFKDQNAEKSIDIEFEDWDTHPLYTAAVFRLSAVWKRYINDYMIPFYGQDAKSKFMNMMHDYQFGEFGDVNLAGQACYDYTTTDDNKDYDMLKALVLDNKLLNDKEKFKILTMTEPNTERLLLTTFFMTAAPFIRLKLLQYFENDGAALVTILGTSQCNTVKPKPLQFEEEEEKEDADDMDIEKKKVHRDMDDKIAFNFIMLEHPNMTKLADGSNNRSRQTEELLQYVLDLDALSYTNKCDLLLHAYTHQEQINYEFHDVYTQSALDALRYGYATIILRFLAKDRRILMKFLNPKNVNDYDVEGKSPLMRLVSSDFDDHDALKVILEESALTEDDIKILLTVKDDNEYTVLYHAMVNEKYSVYFYQLLDYLKKDVKLLTELLMNKIVDGNMSIAQSITTRVRYGYSSSKLIPELEQRLLTVFHVINDDALLNKLLTTKNKQFQTLYDIQSNVCNHDIHSRNSHVTKEEYEVQELILEAMDYIKLALKLKNEDVYEHIDEYVFDGSSRYYMTNPFISACKFGKYHTIMRILNVAKDDKRASDSLVRLLIDNHDKISGNNCLITLYRNGYYKYIIDILNFLDENGETSLMIQLLSYQNPYNGQTVLIEICKNEIDGKLIGDILDCIEDNQAVVKLVKHTKDDKGNCGLDYAEKAVVDKINEYLKV